MEQDAGANISTHQRSRRTAIIDVSGGALWLYLTEPGTLRPISDCWLTNLPWVSSPSSERHAPPPAPASVILDDAQPLPEAPQSYRLDWSDDGHAVQASTGGRSVAFVTASTKLGFHRDLHVSCPWGAPFDRALHERVFESD
jgi:hypothetical protein